MRGSIVPTARMKGRVDPGPGDSLVDHGVGLGGPDLDAVGGEVDPVALEARFDELVARRP